MSSPPGLYNTKRNYPLPSSSTLSTYILWGWFLRSGRPRTPNLLPRCFIPPHCQLWHLHPYLPPPYVISWQFSLMVTWFNITRKWFDNVVNICFVYSISPEPWNSAWVQNTLNKNCWTQRWHHIVKSCTPHSHSHSRPTDVPSLSLLCYCPPSLTYKCVFSFFCLISFIGQSI